MEFLAKAAETGSSTAGRSISDVHFSIAGDRGLVLKGLADLGSGARYLGYRIVDKPTDLRAHVQRILLYLGLNDEPGVRGSLIDLFIALGDKGAALKQRMLDFAVPALSRTAVAFLRKNIDKGFQPWDNAIASTRTSLLSMGYIGVRQLVLPSQKPETMVRSDTTLSAEHPLAQANSQLEYGQLENAVATLEEALRNDPTDKDVASLLDELYQHLRKQAPGHGSSAPSTSEAGA
jgi:hypothetical protein